MWDQTEALRNSDGTHRVLIDRLSGLELFRGVSREALATLAQEIEWLSLPSGCQLFAQGDQADGLYVVLTGRLGVFRTEPDGQQRLVNETVTGDAVGEMALLLGEPRSASVVALRDSELLRLRREAFEILLDRQPQLVLQLTRQLAGRLAHGLQPAPPNPVPRTLALLPLSRRAAGRAVRARVGQSAGSAGAQGSRARAG